MGTRRVESHLTEGEDAADGDDAEDDGAAIEDDDREGAHAREEYDG